MSNTVEPIERHALADASYWADAPSCYARIARVCASTGSSLDTIVTGYLEAGFAQYFVGDEAAAGSLRNALDYALAHCLAIHHAKHPSDVTHIEIRRAETTTRIRLNDTHSPGVWTDAYALAVIFDDAESLRVLADPQLMKACNESVPFTDGNYLHWEFTARAMLEACQPEGQPLAFAETALDSIDMMSDASLRAFVAARYSPVLQTIVAASTGPSPVAAAFVDAAKQYRAYWAGQAEGEGNPAGLYWLELSALALALPGGPYTSTSAYLLPHLSAPRPDIVACPG